jgi:hypothetical protein
LYNKLTTHARCQAFEECPVCKQLYSWESFVHFQPSFENTNVEWNIKKRDYDVVWNAAWIDSVSTKVALLLTRLRALGFFQGLPVDEVWWSNAVLPPVRHCTPKMLCPLSASPFAAAATCTKRTGKCIIFSNFIEAIDSVAYSLGEALPDAGIFMRFTANMKGGEQERIAALKEFRQNPDISILLLGCKGAEGLDLSFVTHIFLVSSPPPSSRACVHICPQYVLR